MAVVATKDDYLHLLKELLPPGAAFPRDDTTSDYALMLDAIAEECFRVDFLTCQLVEEADPRSASMSFYEWETDWGLPDACVQAYSEESQTSEQRRNSLVSKVRMVGGQSRQFFIDMAASIGRTITIDELRQEGQPATYFKWRVNALEEQTEQFATVDMTCDEALASWGDALLECLIRRYAPAHTDVLFAYQ